MLKIQKWKWQDFNLGDIIDGIDPIVEKRFSLLLIK